MVYKTMNIISKIAFFVLLLILAGCGVSHYVKLSNTDLQKIRKIAIVSKLDMFMGCKYVGFTRVHNEENNYALSPGYNSGFSKYVEDLLSASGLSVRSFEDGLVTYKYETKDLPGAKFDNLVIDKTILNDNAINALLIFDGGFSYYSRFGFGVNHHLASNGYMYLYNLSDGKLIASSKYIQRDKHTRFTCEASVLDKNHEIIKLVKKGGLKLHKELVSKRFLVNK